MAAWGVPIGSSIARMRPYETVPQFPTITLFVDPAPIQSSFPRRNVTTYLNGRES